MKILLRCLNIEGDRALNRILMSYNQKEKFKFMRAGIRLFFHVVDTEPLTLHYHQVMLDNYAIANMKHPKAFIIMQTKTIYDKLKKYGVTPECVEVIIE